MTPKPSKRLNKFGNQCGPVQHCGGIGTSHLEVFSDLLLNGAVVPSRCKYRKPKPPEQEHSVSWCTLPFSFLLGAANIGAKVRTVCDMYSQSFAHQGRTPPLVRVALTLGGKHLCQSFGSANSLRWVRSPSVHVLSHVAFGCPVAGFTKA